RLLQRRARIAPPVHAPQQNTEREKRSRAVEDELALAMRVERLPIGDHSVVERTGGCGREAAAAPRRGERISASEPARVGLVPVEHLAGRLQEVQEDQRLDVVDDERHGARLADSLVANELDDRRKPRRRLLVLAEEEIELR